MTHYHPVKPLKSPVAWVGGKRRLAPAICAQINQIDHDAYVEVFMGMGGVFLARDRRPKAEVINDASRDVVNLFRVAKYHPDALLAEMRLALVSRADFRIACATPPETLTDIQRAARFFLIQRLNYGGKPDSTSFPARGNANKGIHLDRLQASLYAIRDRLAGVVIEEMDWTDLLRRYDRPGTLFYADPPYWGCEDYYGKGMFNRADHARLAEALLGLSGRFILSINDVPDIRALYAGKADIVEVSTKYTVAGGGAQAVSELLIMGAGGR